MYYNIKLQGWSYPLFFPRNHHGYGILCGGDQSDLQCPHLLNERMTHHIEKVITLP